MADACAISAGAAPARCAPCGGQGLPRPPPKGRPRGRSPAHPPRPAPGAWRAPPPGGGSGGPGARGRSGRGPQLLDHALRRPRRAGGRGSAPRCLKAHPASSGTCPSVRPAAGASRRSAAAAPGSAGACGGLDPPEAGPPSSARGGCGRPSGKAAGEGTRRAAGRAGPRAAGLGLLQRGAASVRVGGRGARPGGQSGGRVAAGAARSSTGRGRGDPAGSPRRDGRRRESRLCLSGPRGICPRGAGARTPPRGAPDPPSSARAGGAAHVRPGIRAVMPLSGPRAALRPPGLREPKGAAGSGGCSSAARRAIAARAG